MLDLTNSYTEVNATDIMKDLPETSAQVTTPEPIDLTSMYTEVKPPVKTKEGFSLSETAGQLYDNVTNMISNIGDASVEAYKNLGTAQTYIDKFTSPFQLPEPKIENVTPLVKVPGGDYSEHKTTIGEDFKKGLDSLGEVALKFAPYLDPNKSFGENVTTYINTKAANEEAFSLGLAKPALGLGRFSSMISGQDTKWFDEAIDNIDKRITTAGKISPMAPSVATIASFMPQVAAGFVQGAAIFPQMAIQGITGAIRSAAERNDAGQLNSLGEMLTNGVLESVATGGIMGTLKIVNAGITRNFMSEDVWNLVNKQEKGFETLSYMAKYAKDNDIPLSSMLFKNLAPTNLPPYIDAENYFAIQEAFRGQEKFAGKLFDLQTDILNTLSKGKEIDFTNHNMVNAFEKEIQTNIQELSKAYKSIEDELYGEFTTKLKAIPNEYRIDTFFKDLNMQLKDAEGGSPQAVDVIKNITDRFKKDSYFKEDMKQISILENEKRQIVGKVNSLRAYGNAEAAKGNFIESEKIFSQIDDLKLQLKEKHASIEDLKNTKYMTLSNLVDTSKQINQRLFKPGGAISVKDQFELRTLRLAKTKIDEFIEQRLDEVSPELFKEWNNAKSVTKMRTSIYGPKNSGSEEGDLFANALMSKDMNKVFEAITDPHNGLKNLTYIKEIMGKDSELFQKGTRLYFEDKMGILKGMSAWKEEGVPFTRTFADFRKVSQNLSKITDDDFKFISANYGSTISKDLYSLKELSSGFAKMESAFNESGFLPSPTLYIAQKDSVHRSLKLVKDAVAYSMGKSAQSIVNNMPVLRSISGAGLGAAKGVEEGTQDPKDTEWGTILGYTGAGAAGGYAAGTILRPILSPAVDNAVRYLTKGQTRAAMREVEKLEGLIESVGNKEVKIAGQKTGKTFSDYFPNIFQK